jgi:biotin carboxyl carrier protein
MTEDTIVMRVREIAEAFTVAGLIRLTMKDAGFELEVRRARSGVNAERRTVEPDPDPPAAAEEAPTKKPDIVSSDLVGVLRFSRPQVNEGQLLESDRELAFVEALGIRNPVRSRGVGRVAAVFVTDGQPVEFGQPLFAIDR